MNPIYCDKADGSVAKQEEKSERQKKLEKYTRRHNVTYFLVYIPCVIFLAFRFVSLADAHLWPRWLVLPVCVILVALVLGTAHLLIEYPLKKFKQRTAEDSNEEQKQANEM